MAELMRGAVLTATGSIENIEFRKDLPKPSPKPHELLVRVQCCGISDADKRIILGDLHSRFLKLPATLGVDIAGKVEQIGREVEDFKVGDDIAGILAADCCGGFAEYVCIPYYQAVVRPSLVSDEDAAAVLSPGLRAYTALQYKMKLLAGETVLVMNGASVYGTVMIQLALSWGAKVITTASTLTEFNYLQGLSANIDRVIDLTSENFLSAVMEETNSLGVDAIVHSDIAKLPEAVNSTCSFDLSSISKRDYIRCLAPQGIWITTSEIQLDPPESRALLMKSASISLIMEQTWLLAPSQQGRFLHILTDVLDKVSRGLVRVKVSQTFSLERIRQGIKEADTNIGCTLIKI